MSTKTFSIVFYAGIGAAVLYHFTHSAIVVMAQQVAQHMALLTPQ